MSAEGHDHGHDHEHEHHHKTFITKYIFSLDHKMIAKQYLITGILWDDYRCRFVYARMQLAWPELLLIFVLVINLL
jgi:cytochrome c oxidase subunit 1